MAATSPPKLDATPQARTDQEALLKMLIYIQSECQRLGAAESARHVAMAAALMPVAWPQQPAATPQDDYAPGLH